MSFRQPAPVLYNRQAAPIISRMKFLSDFLPVALFFGSYLITHDMFLATKVLVAATALLFAWTWFKHRKVDAMQWINLVLSVVLGAATVISHNDLFIIWKFTVLYWLMAIALLVSDFMGKNGLKLLMGEQIQLPQAIWRKLAYAWAVFFASMGALNLYVAFNFSREIWLSFKLFGSLGLMVVFVIAQSLFLSKYIEEKK